MCCRGHNNNSEFILLSPCWKIIRKKKQINVFKLQSFHKHKNDRKIEYLLYNKDADEQSKLAKVQTKSNIGEDRLSTKHRLCTGTTARLT